MSVTGGCSLGHLQVPPRLLCLAGFYPAACTCEPGSAVTRTPCSRLSWILAEGHGLECLPGFLAFLFETRRSCTSSRQLPGARIGSLGCKLDCVGKDLKCRPATSPDYSLSISLACAQLNAESEMTPCVCTPPGLGNRGHRSQCRTGQSGYCVTPSVCEIPWSDW